VADIKFRPNKTKITHKPKIGKKINLDLKGNLSNKNILRGKPLRGSKLEASGSYDKGGHSIRGKVNYRPDTNEGTVAANYTYKFNKGGRTMSERMSKIGKLFYGTSDGDQKGFPEGPGAPLTIDVKIPTKLVTAPGRGTGPGPKKVRVQDRKGKKRKKKMVNPGRGFSEGGKLVASFYKGGKI
jgi:hypothetical protein